MLKFLLKTFLTVFILLGFGSYANYLMTGRAPTLDIQSPVIPDINISDISSDITENISQKIKPTEKKNNDAKEYMYKWRDSKGVIYYSSERPPDDINYESIAYNKETNVVPAIKPGKSPEPTRPSNKFVDNVYSPEGIKNLFEQAKDIQNIVNDQFQQQDQVIEAE